MCGRNIRVRIGTHGMDEPERYMETEAGYERGTYNAGGFFILSGDIGALSRRIGFVGRNVATAGGMCGIRATLPFLTVDWESES